MRIPHVKYVLHICTHPHHNFTNLLSGYCNLLISMTCAALLTRRGNHWCERDPSLGRCYFKTPNLLLALAGCKWWIFRPEWITNCTFLRVSSALSLSSWKFWSIRRISGVYSLHLLLKMLQKFEVWKGVVHAVLNQAFSKMMAVLSVLSEIMPRMYRRCDVFNMFNTTNNVNILHQVKFSPHDPDGSRVRLAGI